MADQSVFKPDDITDSAEGQETGNMHRFATSISEDVDDCSSGIVTSKLQTTALSTSLRGIPLALTGITLLIEHIIHIKNNCNIIFVIRTTVTEGQIADESVTTVTKDALPNNKINNDMWKYSLLSM